jgi:micrococcal nuclease
MYEYRALVERVVDGDTVDVRIDLGFDVWVRERLRVAAIDAPERFTPSGKGATAHAQALLPVGEEVLVRTEKDRTEKFGRYLATIEMPGGFDFGMAMLKAGYAVVYEQA